tara:strand:- start:73 stop:492 length:420 start_codon:yes stop_codon:yes gene_type:complete
MGKRKLEKKKNKRLRRQQEEEQYESQLQLMDQIHYNILSNITMTPERILNIDWSPKMRPYVEEALVRILKDKSVADLHHDLSNMDKTQDEKDEILESLSGISEELCRYKLFGSVGNDEDLKLKEELINDCINELEIVLK